MSNFLSFLFFSIISFSIYAEALDIPTLNSPVVDEVGLLPSDAKRQLESTLFAFKQNSGIQLQVYVIKSLGGDSIESVAIQVFDKWKLGDEKLDRGLLFLIAPNEKRLRIEVGQGLEGDLPDVIAKRIVSDVVAPYFKRGEYAVGIFQGVTTIQNYVVNVSPEQKAQLKQNAEEGGGTSGKGNFWIILIVIIIWFIIFLINPSLALHLLFAAMSGGRGGGGGGGGGGSWSGGGGRSSGGGASGSW